ncbi:hypothetical protein [Holdemania filiformis]|uniref:hypothetical protein n=1 Tax=Holdemania filiformis TaxID=61171 RepID=UPI0012EAC157|nr:hypothetical protein [Holdemania filiformis]
MGKVLPFNPIPLHNPFSDKKRLLAGSRSSGVFPAQPSFPVLDSIFLKPFLLNQWIVVWLAGSEFTMKRAFPEFQ